MVVIGDGRAPRVDAEHHTPKALRGTDQLLAGLVPIDCHLEHAEDTPLACLAP
jgi:hypothetical protein